MTNIYFNNRHKHQPFVRARGEEMDLDFDLVEEGFDKIDQALTDLINSIVNNGGSLMSVPPYLIQNAGVL